VAQIGERDGLPIRERVRGGDGEEGRLVHEALVLQIAGDLGAEGHGDVEPAVLEIGRGRRRGIPEWLGSCRSTSRRARPGGSSWRVPASTRASLLNQRSAPDARRRRGWNVMASVEPGASAAIWRNVAAIASLVKKLMKGVPAALASAPRGSRARPCALQ
jgi:hypothetical protein